MRDLSKLFTVSRSVLVLSFLIVTASAQTNWPAFRGADSRGIGTGENLPVRWSATENVAWKTDIPGRGWSCPVVWGERVFLTTVVNKGKSEAPRKGLYFGGERPKIRETVHLWKVLCLDLKSGKILWDKTVHEAAPKSAIHLKSSYASETPVVDSEQVYCYFGNLGLFVFDHEGNAKWEKKFTPHKTRYGWGTAASPVLHEDRLYLLNDNEEKSWLLALNKKTGDEIWKRERDEKSNWSTPYIWVHKKRTEIVTPGTGTTRSYDLDGTVLWSFRGMSSITIATPYAADGLLYISSGYVGDRKKPIYAIKPMASGDLSITTRDSKGSFIKWCNWKAAPYNPSTLVYNGQLFVLLDRGWLHTYDPKTGEPSAEKVRLPAGPGFTCSPWAYGGKVFCLDEDGKTTVFEAGEQPKMLHTNVLGDDDMCMATPAIVGDRLLIRSSARLYCIRNGAGK